MESGRTWRLSQVKANLDADTGPRWAFPQGLELGCGVWCKIPHDPPHPTRYHHPTDIEPHRHSCPTPTDAPPDIPPQTLLPHLTLTPTHTDTPTLPTPTHTDTPTPPAHEGLWEDLAQAVVLCEGGASLEWDIVCVEGDSPFTL